MIARPGAKESHGAVERCSMPSRTMLPHVGVGGETPMPRKLRLASTRMAEAGHDQQLAHDVGQDALPQHVERARAKGEIRLDELAFAQGQRAAVAQAREPGRHDESDGDEHLVHALPEHHEYENGKDFSREAHHGIGAAHDEGTEPPAP